MLLLFNPGVTRRAAALHPRLLLRWRLRRKKVKGIGRPRRQQLRILLPLKMLRLPCSSYACSVHLQPLPERAPALPGRFAGVQSQIFYAAGLIAALIETCLRPVGPKPGRASTFLFRVILTDFLFQLSKASAVFSGLGRFRMFFYQGFQRLNGFGCITIFFIGLCKSLICGDRF